MELVNKVRRRAKLQDLNLGDNNTLATFNAAVLTERQHEYWAENGQLRADLIRMGEFLKRALLVGGTQAVQYSNVNEYLMPFSQGKVDEGKGLFIQNPGYDQ